MGELIRLEDNKPHFVFSVPIESKFATSITRYKAVVVPLSLVRKWASGEIEMDKECTRVIINEWLSFVEDNYD